MPNGLPPAVEQRLHAGLRALDLALDAAPSLLAYLALLVKWNKAFNLSAVRDPLEMVDRHVLDSLSVLPYVGSGRLLDVGSGAGLPGIPLALVSPALDVVLLDSNGKKTRFLKQVRLELGIPNIAVVHSRLEDYRPESPFDVVISRAFAEAETFFTLARPHAAPDGRLLAMKGRRDDNEIAKIDRGSGKLVIHTLNVPGLAAARHLFELRLTA